MPHIHRHALHRNLIGSWARDYGTGTLVSCKIDLQAWPWFQVVRPTTCEVVNALTVVLSPGYRGHEGRPSIIDRSSSSGDEIAGQNRIEHDLKHSLARDLPGHECEYCTEIE